MSFDRNKPQLSVKYLLSWYKLTPGRLVYFSIGLEYVGIILRYAIFDLVGCSSGENSSNASCGRPRKGEWLVWVS